jgi:ribose transport system ATP-binding protein/rhamnose transport system ATP-binding protein
VRELTIAQRQLVEILKSLALDSRIVIFDEPTASLSPHESERLFDLMRSLVRRGRGLIFVSHRLEEIFTVSDRVTILREGRVVGESLPTQTLSPTDLVRRMVGRELSDVYARSGAAAPGAARPEIALSVRNLAAPPRVRDVSFDVHAGEILGLAGLVGAGRSETLEAIFGLRRATGGTIELAGRRFAPKSPLDAIRAGIGFIPEDRRVQGIVPDFTVRENLLLAHLGRHAGPMLAYGTQRAAIERLLQLLELPSERLLDASMLNFSGGMQQKVILARWLLLQPRVLLLDEPTRGVDIGTRSSIYALLRRIAADGVAMVVVSSDFEEVLGIADRIIVMSDGCDVTAIPNKLVDVEKLTMFAAPRSSAERTHTVLEALVREYGGVASWIAVDGERVFCFDRIGDDPEADPGFAAGAFPTIEETSIGHALRARKDEFVTEADDRRRTLLVPIRGRRGHDFGLIGLTLAGHRPTPDARRLSAQVHEWMAATHAGPPQTLGVPA